MTYLPGEIVDILVEDARVVEHRGGSLSFEYDSAPFGSVRSSIQTEANHVSIKRILPAESPKPGELWQDATGRRWLAAAVDDLAIDVQTVRLFGPGAGPAGVDVSQIHHRDGPLIPVYREGEAS